MSTDILCPCVVWAWVNIETPIVKFFIKSIKLFLYQIENHCSFHHSLFLFNSYNDCKEKCENCKCKAWWILMKWTHRHLDQETEHDYYFKTLLLRSSRHSYDKKTKQKNLPLLLTWHIFACFWSVNSITFYAVFYMKFLSLSIIIVSSTFVK